MIEIQEVKAKSIFVPSKLPDADFVLNPYIGCQFGCLYCYASFMGRFVKKSRSDWGHYVFAKVNSVELAEKQLKRWSPEKRFSSLLLSSVTDPYQGIENKYCLTRGILEVLKRYNYPGSVSVLTKSPLVLRDVDILTKLRNVEVGLTITTTNDSISRWLEVKAPLATRRLETLRYLNKRGIRTYAFIGPLLPHFLYQPQLLDELLKEIREIGTKQVYVEHINLPAYIRERLWSEFGEQPEEVKKAYRKSQSDEYRMALTEIVKELTQKYELEIRLGGAIYHRDIKT